MGAKPAPPLPEPQPVTRMPDQKNAAAKEAETIKRNQIIAQSGRESTNLSNDSMNTVLGS